MLSAATVKPQAGFTLAEMMVTVAIMAVLLALAAPSFQTLIRNAKIRTTADSMQAGLQLARSEALRRNAHVSFWLVDSLGASCMRSASGTSWVVSFDNPAGACNAPSAENVAPRLVQSRSGGDGSTGVSVGAVNGGATPAAASCITFNGFGSVEAACGGGTPIGSIVIASAVAANSYRSLELRISSGGAVRMCDPSVAATTDPSHC